MLAGILHDFIAVACRFGYFAAIEERHATFEHYVSAQCVAELGRQQGVGHRYGQCVVSLRRWLGNKIEQPELFILRHVGTRT